MLQLRSATYNIIIIIIIAVCLSFSASEYISINSGLTN
jgi:hypothetical protein